VPLCIASAVCGNPIRWLRSGWPLLIVSTMAVSVGQQTQPISDSAPGVL
jgi:hypothetical protein